MADPLFNLWLSHNSLFIPNERNNTDKNQGGEEENQTLNEMRKEFTAKDTQFNPPKIPRSVQNAVASG